MKTIYFTNRERIMIGENPIEFMTYLQKKLPAANYSESGSDEEVVVRPDSPRETNNSKQKYQPQHPQQQYSDAPTKRLSSLPVVSEKRPSIN